MSKPHFYGSTFECEQDMDDGEGKYIQPICGITFLIKKQNVHSSMDIVYSIAINNNAQWTMFIALSTRKDNKIYMVFVQGMR